MNCTPNPEAFTILLVFEDSMPIVRKCSTETLLAFDLPSGSFLGTTTEHAFIRQLRKNIMTITKVEPAAVSYYIMSGSIVTIAIPSAEPDRLQSALERHLTNFGVMRCMINVVPRERA